MGRRVIDVERIESLSTGGGGGVPGPGDCKVVGSGSKGNSGTASWAGSLANIPG